MNIKEAIGRLLGVKDSMVNKGWEDTVTFKELKYILEGLDEPTERKPEYKAPVFFNDNISVKLYVAEGTVSVQKIEIEKLKEELANARQSNEELSKILVTNNGIVKNLEEQLASRKVYGVPVVTKQEYQEKCLAYENLYNECILKRNRIDKYYASCEKIREVLNQLQSSLRS